VVRRCAETRVREPPPDELDGVEVAAFAAKGHGQGRFLAHGSRSASERGSTRGGPAPESTWRSTRTPARRSDHAVRRVTGRSLFLLDFSAPCGEVSQRVVASMRSPRVFAPKARWAAGSAAAPAVGSDGSRRRRWPAAARGW
jgi:hypothetical protein